MKTIVLASKSTDRNLLFERAKIPVEVLITNIDEDQYKAKISNSIELVKRLAEAKALNAKDSLINQGKDAIIIAADTIVELDNKIIGKAKNEAHAFEILKKLVDNTHNLITGFAITETNNPKIIIDHEITSVQFINISDNEIHDYLKSGEWKGRAGAYSIRERASLFIKSIQGSSSSVIGLPMHRIFEILKKEFNINLLQID